MQIDTYFLVGATSVLVAIGVGIAFFKNFVVSNPERHEVLKLHFGKLQRRIVEPGMVGATKLWPHERWITVSRQWDERVFKGVETNDAQGTLVQVDLRVTFRIADADKALFSVDDWEQALESTTVHEAAAALAGKDRMLFLKSAVELSTALAASIKSAMADYGIEIRDIRVMNVELRPEVTRQMFEAVAAKLEVAKAEYEEKGRTDAALLLARTEQRVAELEARAKTENLKAIGRAYRQLRERPEIFESYTDLYRLSQLDPTRVVSFGGFDEGELSRAALVESDLERDGHHEARNGHSPVRVS
jgi:regulator of protease activity HflC (stomatin/prohibitin superfamily)